MSHTMTTESAPSALRRCPSTDELVRAIEANDLETLIRALTRFESFGAMLEAPAGSRAITRRRTEHSGSARERSICIATNYLADEYDLEQASRGDERRAG